MKIKIVETKFGHPVYYGRQMLWLKGWLWGTNLTSSFYFPSDTIIKQLAKYVPKKPITLFRAHDNATQNTVLQSWTHDYDIAKEMAYDSDRIVKESTFAPNRILVDVTKIDYTIQKHLLEHMWDEVIVINGSAIKYIQKIRELR